MIREAMAAANLTAWPQMALMLFLSVFVLITIWTFRAGKSADYDNAARSILDDDLSLNGAGENHG